VVFLIIWPDPGRTEMAELSEDLLKFLGDCEKCFENRFSEEDTAFNDYVQTPQRGPPIEERWS